MSRWGSHGGSRGEDYDRRWRELAASGASIHGEADLVASLAMRHDASVLDAGCGTGRVAIELARRGFDVVGVDLDPGMLAAARSKAPGLRWIEADLLDVGVPDPHGAPRAFDVVVAAGNVMIFLTPGTEAAVIGNLAHHLVLRGLLVAGFQTDSGRLGLEEYDRHCAAAGLELQSRWATWERDAFVDGGPYAVSVHRRTG